MVESTLNGFSVLAVIKPLNTSPNDEMSQPVSGDSFSGVNKGQKRFTCSRYERSKIIKYQKSWFSLRSLFVIYILLY